MLKQKTLFVVGAGASNEFHLPLGAELALHISDKLDIKFELGSRPIGGGDFSLFESFRRSFPDQAGAYQQAAWVIRDGIVLANSVDDFLHLHQENAEVVKYGKAAILKCVLEAERASSLYLNEEDRSRLRIGVNFRNNAGTWLVKLIKLLGKNVPRAKRTTIFKDCAFVVFNYDRCIEHGLVNALQPMYNINAAEAASIVETVPILHPYGSAGSYVAPGGRGEGIQFGSLPPNFGALTDLIKTYTERVDASEIRRLVTESDRIVFLGFAFHAPNMEVLAERESLMTKQIYGTAFGESDSNVEVIKTEINVWSKRPLGQGHKVHILNRLKCADLFDEFSKTL